MKQLILLVILGLLTSSLIIVNFAEAQYSVQGTVTSFTGNPQLTAVDPYAKPDRPNQLNPERPYWYVADASGLTILKLGTNEVLGTIPWPATYELAQPNGTTVNVAAPSVVVQNGDGTSTSTPNWEPLRLMVPFPSTEDLGPEALSGADVVAFVEMAHSGYQWGMKPGSPFRDLIVANTDPELESSLMLMIVVTDPAQPEVLAGAILGHEAGQMAWDPNGGVMYVANMPSNSLPPELASFISKITAPEAGAEAPPIYAPKTFYPLCGPEIEWSGEVKEEAKMGIPVNVPEAWICDAINGPGEGEGPFTYKFEGLPTWLTVHGLNATTGEGDGLLYGTPTEVGSYPFKVTVTDTPTGATASAVFTINVMPAVTEFAGGEMEIEAGVTGAFAIWATPGSTCATANGATPVPPWFEIQTVPNGCVMIMNSPTLAGEYFDFVFTNLTRIDPRTGVAYPTSRHVSAEVLGTYNFDTLPVGVGLSGIAWHEVDMIPGEPDKYVLNGEFIAVDASTGQLYRVVLPYEGSDTIEELPPDSLEMVIGTNVVSTEGVALTKLAGERFGDVVVEADGDIFVSVLNQDPKAAGAVIKVSGGVSQRIDLFEFQPSYLALDSDLEPAVLPALGGVGQLDYGYLLATGSSGVAEINTSAGTANTIVGATEFGGVAIDSIATGIAYVAGKVVPSVSMFGSATARNSAPVMALINPAEALVDPTLLTVGKPAEIPLVAVGWPIPTVSVSGVLPAGLQWVDNGNGSATIFGTPAPLSGGIYTLTATATNAAGSTTQTFTLTVENVVPPQITSSNTATLVVGVAGQFKVEAIGTPNPILTYTGTLPAGVTFHDNGACTPAVTVGVCNGSAFIGGLPTATGSSQLTITATNSQGSVSQEFTLKISEYVVAGTETMPSVTANPESQTVIEGQTATFTAAATGIPAPSVQWQLKTPDSGDFGNVLGATGTSYKTAPTTTSMSGYQYRAVFTNSTGAATGNPATLTVNTVTGAPVITTQPTTMFVPVGQTATFTAEATGNPVPTVQWQQSGNNGSTWTNIAGATSITYSTPVTLKMKDNKYRAIFKNINGTATSKAATLLIADSNGGGSAPGFVKVSLNVGSEPEGIAVNPVTHTAYILSRDMATNTKNVVVVDSAALNGGSPKHLEMPRGGAQNAPKLIGIANDHEYIAIDSTRNLIYVPTKYAVPDVEPGEPPEEGDEPSAEVMGTLTVIDGETNAVLTSYAFAKGVMPEGVAVDKVNNIVYIAVKLPEPEDPGGCPIDPVTGQAECEMTGGMIYAFSAANVRATTPTLGNPLIAVPAEEPESIVFDPVNRLLYAADESKGSTVIVPAVDSNGVSSGNRVAWLPIWTTPGFAVSGPNPYALPCSPYEADKMTVGLDGAVYITDDKSRVARIVNKSVAGMTHIDLPGGDNTPLYCYGEEPVQGQNTANNIGFMKTEPDPVTGAFETRLYVVSEQDTVAVLDPITLELKSTINVPGATHLDGIAVDGSNGKVWITDEVGLLGMPETGAVYVLQGACAKGIASCVKQ